MKAEIIRTTGEHEFHDIPDKRPWTTLYKLTDSESFDSVNLRDGRIMFVDDTGMVDGKPVNQEATELYHSICKPGTVWAIHGDVAIVRNEDFA